MNIRDYSDINWPRLCEIHDAARKDKLALANLEEAFVPMSEAAENEDLFDYTVLVAESEGIVKGFTAYCDDELCWLYGDPKERRSGIGSALIQEVLRRNPNPLTVEILEGNIPAQKTYEKAGFVFIRKVSGRIPGNEKFHVTVNELKHRRDE